MTDDTIMLWLTIAALIVSVAFLAYRAGRRRGYRPFCAGFAAAFCIVVGKFVIDIPLLFYSGVVLLFIL